MPPPKKIERTKAQNTAYGFLVLKLTTKGGAKDRPPLIDELLEELPKRAAWLDLPLDRVKELHANATRIHNTEKAPFKNTFIKLLDGATASTTNPVKPEKTREQLDDEAEEAYQEQQRADEELRRRREQNSSPPGAGGGGASGGR